jgi:hypothetical protein
MEMGTPSSYEAATSYGMQRLFPIVGNSAFLWIVGL